MSDLTAMHAKLDAIIERVAEMRAVTVTHDDLTEMRATIATRDDLTEMRATIATRDDLAEMRATIATRDELAEVHAAMHSDLTATRVALMDRIDRLQDAATIQHNERIVDVASSERAERLAKAARDDAAAIGEVVTPLVRVVHMMRTQLDDLAEQVRILKEGRAA